eukprot:COSAG03_NODE_14_length_22296_cov_10.813128_19_plen_391_part_00
MPLWLPGGALYHRHSSYVLPAGVPPPSRMQRVRSVAQHLGLSAPSVVQQPSALSVPLTEVPPGVKMTPDITFLLDETRGELADLYQPQTRRSEAGPGAAIVFIHGGGWTGGDKDQPRSINVCSHLALHGYTCLNINYLLASPTPGDYAKAAWPQNYYDCQRGVQWVRQHAEELHIDPTRIGVIGGSAGGHLAHMVALAPPGLTAKDPTAAGLLDTAQFPVDGVRCAVNLYGPADFLIGIGDVDKPGASLTMFPGPLAAHQELYRQASPVAHIHAGNPPVFLLHGSADTTVDIRQSELYVAKAQACGAPVRFRKVVGAPHAFHLEPLDGRGDSDLCVIQTRALFFFLVRISVLPSGCESAIQAWSNLTGMSRCRKPEVLGFLEENLLRSAA